jgi:hypothetical protein
LLTRAARYGADSEPRLRWSRFFILLIPGDRGPVHSLLENGHGWTARIVTSQTVAGDVTTFDDMAVIQHLAAAQPDE